MNVPLRSGGEEVTLCIVSGRLKEIRTVTFGHNNKKILSFCYFLHLYGHDGLGVYINIFYCVFRFNIY
jgi:hypothetical protein